MTESDQHIDPTSLSLAELRELRSELQRRDDVVSYARRVAQARLDLVKAEVDRRRSDVDVTEHVADVLSHQLTGGPARPPRPTEDLSDDALSRELDGICYDHHYSRFKELDEAELGLLAEVIGAFEQRVSNDRRQRFEQLDALSAELVRRYREGEADVDSLLAEGT